MDPVAVQAIRESWHRIVPQAERVATVFYDHLFASEPHLKPLFAAVEMPEQRRKLVAALSLVVTSLENPSALRPLLEALGQRHQQYGVRPADYQSVGASLIAALRETLGATFTPGEMNAWLSAYGTISQIMLEGAAADPIEPRD